MFPMPDYFWPLAQQWFPGPAQPTFGATESPPTQAGLQAGQLNPEFRTTLHHLLRPAAQGLVPAIGETTRAVITFRMARRPLFPMTVASGAVPASRKSSLINS